jgi:hypothetical protein
VARRLLNNYMDDAGTRITLSQAEMIGCNPVVDLRRSAGFQAEVRRLAGAGGGSATISVTGWGGAMTNGTLGNSTIRYAGTVTVARDGTWSFNGTMTFIDYWDFDPKPFGSGSGRPVGAEIKVRVADAAIPGRPFPVDSVSVPVSQSSADARATWAAGDPPRHVPDRAGRTGADIEAGGVGGGVETGGAGGVEVGAEAGAQSSEDLNRR